MNQSRAVIDRNNLDALRQRGCHVGQTRLHIVDHIQRVLAETLQRDPAGDARREATGLADVAGKAGQYAFGDVRAPLRIMAIGMLVVALGIGFAIVSVILALIG